MAHGEHRVLAFVLAALLWPCCAAVASAAPITVMSQNLYVGADADAVISNPTPATVEAAFQSVLANNFPARANAIAAEAAHAGGPLLIGLQEASVIGAPTGTLDYAQVLVKALADQGLHYSATIHQGFIFALGGFSVRDQDVVLARTDVPGFTVISTETQTFAHNLLLPTPLGQLSLDAGYVLVNASLDGAPFQFVSTHLDPFHTPLQPLQANEIIAELDKTDEPQVVVGDFNAGPTEPTYLNMLAAGFTDAAAVAGAVGPTCCQAADLDNPVSLLRNRYDYVFERGFSSIGSAYLVGDTVFEDVRPLWPSDHAGVIASIDLPEPSTLPVFILAVFLLAVFRMRAAG